LVVSNNSYGIELGSSNAISGKVIVSAPQDDEAFIFCEPAGGWKDMTQTATLKARHAYDFGTSVAISGNVVTVGAPGYPDGANYGATYLFYRPRGGWQTTSSPNVTFHGSGSEGPQEIGYSVGIDGTTVVAGAAWYKNGKGAAYVYAK
jgi:hypothetical protein